MASIKPYTIDVPDSALETLQEKLKLTSLPKHQVEDGGWTYGTPVLLEFHPIILSHNNTSNSSEITRLTEYWGTNYDWKAKEKELNQLPNFTAQITVDGFEPLDVHFLHQKSDVKGAIPLLFVHGWPGSFLEVTKMLPLLKGDDGRPAFEVVAPSLPNYVFSSGVKKKGFAIKQYAEACHRLMLALGYEQYVTQGGDWGFFITRALANLYPTSCKAHHINWIFATPPAPSSDPSAPTPEYTPRELAALARGQEWYQGDGRGYLTIQGTKPATIGFAFADSPVALLAWIYEKLAGWSDEYPWTDDEILTWVSLYWFSTAGPEAASYHYYEALHGGDFMTAVLQKYINVPLGLADFPKELANAPKSWWGSLGPVVYEKSFDKGGHFAAWERPQDIADSLCEMYGKGGGAEGVVVGRNGY